jgi:hypothetical protein
MAHARVTTGFRTDEEDSTLSSGKRGELPASAFLWTDPEGVHHLPYKSASGAIDLPHLRNAAARLSQVKGMPEDVRTKIKAKIEKLLGKNDAADVTRFDRWELGAPTESADGFMDFEGQFARAGIYLYRNADGSVRRELVPVDVLLNADDLATLSFKPVTLRHPKVGKVTPKTAKALQVGSTGQFVDADIKRDGTAGSGRVRFNVTDEEAIRAIKSGTVRELSPGYTVRIDETPGIDEVFGAYDCRQIGRTYNHLAIVEAARGGSECRLRADGNQDPEDAPMLTAEQLAAALVAGGLDAAVAKVRADAMMDAMGSADLMAKHMMEAHKANQSTEAMLAAEKAEHGKTKDSMGALQKECDAMKAEKASMEQDVPPMDKKDGKDEPLAAYAVRYAARDAKVRAIAKAHKVDVTDGMDIGAIEKAVVLKVDAAAVGRDRNYYAARVDSLPESGRFDVWRVRTDAAPVGDWMKAAQGGEPAPVAAPQTNSYMTGLNASRSAK